MLRKFMDAVNTQKSTRDQENIYRDLIRTEAGIGGNIFGSVPNGHRREFFCLDKHTWIWHEEWLDDKGVRQTMTTRYDIRPDGILKSQGGKGYSPVTPSEARNLITAAKEYRNRTFNQLYRVAP